MRLTKLGRDYQLAIVLLSTAALVMGETILAALALGMAFASLVSLALLKIRTPDAVQAKMRGPSLRVFKGEEGRIVLEVPGVDGRWVRIEVEAVEVDGPVEAKVVSRSGDQVEVALRPSAAGRFTRASVRLGLQDAMGLFESGRRAELAALTVDSMPLSLLAPRRRALVPPLVVGESPAGTAGKGQEFYGIEPYSEGSESRDIMWKRAAKAPDRPLLARVREANSPESVGVVVVRGEIEEEANVRSVDLQCEALGMIGRAILLAGIRCDIMSPEGKVLEAETDQDLVEAIMEASVPGGGRGLETGYVGLKVYIVVGKADDGQWASPSRDPVVFVESGRIHARDHLSADFTGVEDLTRTVNMVLGR